MKELKLQVVLELYIATNNNIDKSRPRSSCFLHHSKPHYNQHYLKSIKNNNMMEQQRYNFYNFLPLLWRRSIALAMKMPAKIPNKFSIIFIFLLLLWSSIALYEKIFWDFFGFLELDLFFVVDMSPFYMIFYFWLST